MNSVTDAISKVTIKKGENTPCLLCEERFPKLDEGTKHPLLAHLLQKHKIIIGDVDQIAYFHR